MTTERIRLGVLAARPGRTLHGDPVLHAFQKKSKTGRETPRRDTDLIKQRLREAEEIANQREK